MSHLIDHAGAPDFTRSDAFNYRLKASKLGRMAQAEPNQARMLTLLHEALAWIELAQNEELLTAGETHLLQ